MKNVVIGTAGHVDHGKTSLIKILTGMDTDSLIEEKKRGISIDLGFAFFDLPSGKRVGIVDVPGHEKFIKNMLAGATGIDVVLIVIACDEGVKPQTIEHLDILRMLDIRKGIVVLTKRDLVDDELYELVKEEVKSILDGTFLQNSNIIGFSARTGFGYEELIEEIDNVLNDDFEKSHKGPFRLPVDRCFSISGFGTVVTGTIISGKVSINDTLTIYPKNIQCKVRNIQVHEKNCDEAFCGQRCALNLSGVKRDDIKRGFVISQRDSLNSSYMIDCKLLSLDNLSKNILNRQRVRFFCGTDEVIGRIHILDKLEVESGSEAYVQFHLERPVSVLKDDRYVIRNYSPMVTLGGGYVINPIATRVKGCKNEYLEKLKAVEKHVGIDYIEAVIKNDEDTFLSDDYICKKYSIDVECFEECVNEMVEKGILVVFSDDSKEYFVHNENLHSVFANMKSILSQYHKRNKLKIGFLKEELRNKIFSNNVKPKVYDRVLEYFECQNLIKLNSKYVSLFDFKVEISPDIQIMINQIVSEYKTRGFIPPKLTDLETKFNSKDFYNVHRYLEETEILYKVSPEMYLLKEDFSNARNLIVDFLKQNGEISLRDAKEILNSNRKYLVTLLEHLDEIKITIRKKDNRILA